MNYLIDLWDFFQNVEINNEAEDEIEDDGNEEGGDDLSNSENEEVCQNLPNSKYSKHLKKILTSFLALVCIAI